MPDQQLYIAYPARRGPKDLRFVFIGTKPKVNRTALRFSRYGLNMRLVPVTVHSGRGVIIKGRR